MPGCPMKRSGEDGNLVAPNYCVHTAPQAWPGTDAAWQISPEQAYMRRRCALVPVGWRVFVPVL